MCSALFYGTMVAEFRCLQWVQNIPTLQFPNEDGFANVIKGRLCVNDVNFVVFTVKLKEAGYTSNINSDEDEGAYKSSSPAPDSRSNIIIELSTQISEQEYRISSLESQLEEKDQIIAKLQSVKLSPREAKNIIAIEAEKANQEMQELAKELKMLKRKKKRSKVPAEDTINNNNIPPNLVTLDRDLSSLSMDSGAVDLVTSSRSNRKHRQRAIDHDIDIDSLLTPSPTTPSYASSSPLVT